MISYADVRKLLFPSVNGLQNYLIYMMISRQNILHMMQVRQPYFATVNWAEKQNDIYILMDPASDGKRR